MNVGVDAKWFIDGPVSGRVVLNNILLQVRPNESCEVYLFVRKRDLEQVQETLGTELFKYVPLPNFGPSAWTNIFVFPFLMSRHRIDLMLCHYFTPFIYGSRCINVIYDVLWKDYPQYFSFKERIYFDLSLHSSRFAKCVVTISKSEQRRIRKWHPTPSVDIKLMYLAGQSMSREKRCALDVTKYGRYILSVGRLNERKNIGLIASTLSSFPDLTLVVVGSASHLYRDVTDSVDGETRSRMFFLDDVDSADLGDLFRGAWVFCFPSFAEGFGIPPLEAMENGCPVICSQSTSLPEVCGNAVIYIDPGDPDSLVRALSILDEDKRVELSALGRAQASKFSWGKSYEMIADIVSEELDSP